MDTKVAREKAVLVGVSRPPEVLKAQVQDYLNELEQLADTAGAIVLHKIIQERTELDPAFYIGKGKVSELASFVKAQQVDVVIFDEDLSPVQVRNLERTLECKILDRTALILQIFAVHAKSAQAKLQVELAQLEYFLPRLTRQWTHLSKQKGGIGTKGPGETQIETDRRLVWQRIATLRRKLREFDRQHQTQTKWRENAMRIALVGYTNAGKTTLMNALCPRANVRGENQLFATLDTTTRQLVLPPNKQVLLSDTVGFIRKLPHKLVESFKSTLQEVRDADILLHVVDASHPNYGEQIAVVEQTLAEIQAINKVIITVFNKLDKLPADFDFAHARECYPNAVFVSAERGIGIQQLKSCITSIISAEFQERQVRVHVSHYKFISFLHDKAEVLEKHYDGEYIEVRFRAPKKMLAQIDATLRKLNDYAAETQ
ncbi:MAG: GTPase HflX [Chloroherpetonaceae bacterium]|nr:GTPase HflX [Chloroherpetonaceae bacterium]MCS7212345.1 GTPase HflX [Chloroherpetonaceae bacterium]MDW8019416.1 GTPase HflX [Chloroherpetonaceae bacterium]